MSLEDKIKECFVIEDTENNPNEFTVKYNIGVYYSESGTFLIKINNS